MDAVCFITDVYDVHCTGIGSSVLRSQIRKKTVSRLRVSFIFMYLRAILCTFQISVDFYFVPVSGRGGGRGGLEKGRGLERGIECILYRYS